jgi:hypothetical protein
MKILLGILVVIVAFLGFVAMRPAHYRVERSTEVAAPAEVVFDHVDAYKAWPEWSPWEKQDPAMEKTYEGPERGVGAMYSWKSSKVGQGKMTTLESVPGKLVGIELKFIAPYQNTTRANFAFEPSGANTKVTWSMDGDNKFMGKLFGLFMDMDSMVGKDFEKGLAQLKTVAEADAQKRAAEQAAAQAAAAQAAAAQAAAAQAAAPGDAAKPAGPQAQ